VPRLPIKYNTPSLIFHSLLISCSVTAARRAKGDIEGALEDYNKAIQLKPDFANAFNNRGAARRAKGDIESALEDYNEAIRLKPDLQFGHFEKVTPGKIQDFSLGEIFCWSRNFVRCNDFRKWSHYMFRAAR